MAEKKTKKKMIAKNRLRLIALVVAVFVTSVIWALDYTGVMTYEQMLVMLHLVQKPAVDPHTQVHFIDVGQGDCTLIMSGDETLLIDSGDRDTSDTVIGYLRSLGLDRLDYVVVTHQHSDHMGEMSDIINAFAVGEFIMPKLPDKLVPTSKAYEKMLTSLQGKGVGVTKAVKSSFALGECTVQLYPTAIESSDDINNYSVVVRIENGKNSFLVTGDCGVDEEASLIERGDKLSATVLKVGHHGSSTATSAEFLDRVMPKYAVISCGRDNSYGHPHEITVTRISKYADEIYVTADVGTIVFSSDGEGLNIETKKAS